MYCTNCGKEVNSSYKYCKNCGSSIEYVEQDKNLYEYNEEEEQKEQYLGMRYLKFFSTIYLGIVVAINILLLTNYRSVEEWDIFAYSNLLLDIILYIAIPIKLLNDMPKKTKFIYKLLMAFFILDYIYKVIIVSITTYSNNPYTNIQTYMLIATMMYGIWFIPNIIYFWKRKKVFVN